MNPPTPPSPRSPGSGTLPGGKALPPRYIESSRTCLACGYALTGLRVGQPCPECGTPIRVGRTGGLEGLLMFPAAALQRLAEQCGALSMAGGIAVVCTLGAALFREHFNGRPWFQRFLGIDPNFTVVAVCLSSAAAAWLAWAVVAVPLTRPFETVLPGAAPAPTRTALWQARLRGAACVSQFLWPIAGLLMLWIANQEDNKNNFMPVSALLGMGLEEVAFVVEFFRAIALCGMGLLAWNLSRLAFLGNDTALAWKFNAAAFAFVGVWPGIVLGGLLARTMQNALFVALVVVLWILFLLGIGAFGLGLFQLPKLVLAAIGSQRAAVERDRRAVEKANKEREAAQKGEKSPFDSRRTISKPTPCLGCGGEIQGMKYGHKCPQCGHRIGDV